MSTNPELLSVSADLEHLRKSALTGLSIAGFAVSWVWFAAVPTMQNAELPGLQFLMPPLLILFTSTLCLFGKRLPSLWRSLLLMMGVGGALTIALLSGPSTDWIYYQTVVVVIAGVLIGEAASFGVALLLTLAFLAGLKLGFLPLSTLQLLPALGLLWTMAVVAWLASHSLYTALGWALSSQRRAWETADEVRQRRGQLRSALNSLQMTYGLLEQSNRELQSARLEAEEARQVKARFVANISHELRTPLNIIVGFAEMLCTSPESYGGETWSPALREDLLTIWRNAEHLLKMVDDVLDLAQIDATRLPILLERTDLKELIHDTLAAAEALLRNSHLELRVSVAGGIGSLNLDRTRIRQVLLNLINNAVRHTHMGYVEVGAYPRAGEGVVVYVRDSGEGIPKEKLETIFQEFERVDASTQRTSPGAGLGLSISKHLIHMHGGDIWVESEVGKGSTFYFSLPYSEKLPRMIPAQARRGRTRQSHPERGTGAIVALGADPLALRLLDRYLLERPLLPAHSILEAIGLIRSEHPEAAVVMADSPSELSAATDTARTLLQAVAPCDLPVVVCSFPTERRAGYSLGVPELLIKPVTRNDVLAAVTRVCQRPQRVLIVDDDLDMLSLLRRIIVSAWQQVEVLTTTSGREALVLAQQCPDVILLDLLLLEMSGVEALSALRAEPATASIPVVVITARGPAEDLAALRKGEMYVLRNSSFSAGELIRVIELLTQTLPPRYAPAVPEQSHTAGTAPV